MLFKSDLTESISQEKHPYPVLRCVDAVKLYFLCQSKKTVEDLKTRNYFCGFKKKIKKKLKLFHY